MKYSNSIEYNISTKLDKSGLTQLQTQIKQVELTMQQIANKELLNPTKVQNAREQLQGLSTALNKAFNPSLGMLDLAQFRKELSNSKVTAEGLQSAFRLTGAQGAQAFSSLAKQIGHFNSGMERTSSAVDKMFVTFQNTFRWGLISSFFSQFMNAIHSSVQYAKDLDDSLTQIMLVTDYSRDSMNEYAKAANEAAKAVGQTTVGMTNASLIFAQQGYDLDQSQQLATLSAKLANASQQDTAATSDQITAYMNAYGLQDSMEELAQAMDNWALIANISAADVEEIALASQRAASMANAVGVSGEALAAQIATIESVTREAPEQIGNGLKTLYARFSDLKLGKDDEDGIGLGKVTSTLQQIGVQVVDAFGNVRDMDDIMEDLMVVWEDLDDTSKTAAAQALAGKHQVNRFMALMENADMYQEYKGATGASASGTLEEMNIEYLDSLQGRMTKLQSTLEGLFNDVFTTDMVYPLIDGLTKLAEAVDTLFKSIGGGPTIILGLASAFMKLFSTNIARSINDFTSNQQLAETRKSNLANVQGALEQTGLNDTEVGQYIQAGADRAGAMNADQYRIYEQQLDSYITASTNAAAANEKLNDTYLTVAAAAGMLYDNAEDLIVLDETGLNISGLIDEVAARNPKELAESFKNIDWKPAIEGAEELSKSMGRLGIAIDRAKKSEQDLDAVLQMGDKASDNLQILYETGAITSQTYEKLRGILDQTSLELAENGEVTEDTTKEFEQATAVVARYAEALKNIGPEVLTKGPEAVEKALRDQAAAQQALDQNRQSGQGVIGNLDSQLNVENIIKTTASIGQLAFAWQSLANLPSIINNESLTSSEKLLQIISNLSMVLPTVISSMKQLTGLDFSSLTNAQNEENLAKKALDLADARTKEAKATKKAAEEALKSAEIKWMEAEGTGQEIFAEQELSEAKKGLETASKALTSAEASETVAKDAMTVATTKATAAQEAFNAALSKAGIMLAVMAIMTIISAIQKWREEQQALFQERLDASNEQVENAKKELDNIEKLYDAWKKTGEGADELRQALEDQAEALGVVVTAADNYETLTQKIEEATAAQLAYNAALRGENPEAPEFSTEGLSSSPTLMAELGVNKWTPDEGQSNISEQGEIQFNQLYEDAEALKQVKSEELALEYERLAVIKSTGEVDENGNTIYDEEAYQIALDNIYELQQDIFTIDTWLQNNAAAREDKMAQAENAILSTVYNPESLFDFENANYDEILNYVTTLNDSNEWGLSNQQLQDLAISAAEAANNLEAAADAKLRLINEQIQDNDLVSNIPGAEVHKGESGLAQLNRFGEDFNLSNEDLLKVSDMIDWNDPDVDQKVHDLLALIQADMNEGLSLEDALMNQGIQQGTVSDEEILKQERDDKGYVGEDWDRDTESVIEYADSLQELAETSDKINDDLENNRQAALAIADANARLNKGLKSLQDNWEDWNDILSDSANEGTEEYAEALKGTEEALTNILDFDIGTGFADSAQFIQDNADIIEAAINGDMDAIQALRMAAFDQILIDVNADPANLQGDLAECYNLIANTDFDDIEIGTSLDDTGLYDALTTMMYAINTDVTEMQNVLNSLGFEPNVTWYEATAGDTDQATGLTTYTYTSEDGETHTVQMRSELTQNTDGVIRIPIINGSRTTYQGSPGAVARSGGGNRGGGGSSCFIAGTLVSLQNQFKNIEDIQIGDIVLSYNEKIHQNEYSVVLQTMIHNTTEEIYDLYIENETLSVTGIHRFYIRRKHDIEWIMASELNVGDYVLFADGNWHIISGINVKIQTTTVYNFEVSDNHNYYVGRNQILAHNKGGSGGGGSAKTIEKKEKKKHEKDYYEEYDSQLDKIEETLSGIEKQEDKLIGDKARANQAKQIDLLNKEVALQEKKLDILKNQEIPDTKNKLDESIKELQDILSKYGLNLNLPKLEYDEDGIISNFEAISKTLDNKYNELINKQWAIASAGNEEANKKITDALSKVEKENESIKSLIQTLNDLQKTQVEWTNDVQESKDAITDLNIELYKTSMDTIDNLKDLNEKWAEFEGLLTGMPSDSPFRDLTVDLLKLNSAFEISKKDAEEYYQQIIDGKLAAQKATNDQAEKEAIQASINYFTGLRDGLTDDMLKNGLLGLAMTDLEQLEKWYKNDPTAGKNRFGDNQKELVEAYQEGYERVLELSQDWQDLQENIVEDVIDGFDEIAEKQDRQFEKYERLAEEFEEMADIYALSYGDESYKALSDIGKSQAEILKAQLMQYNDIYAYWQIQYDKAVDTGNEELMNAIEDRMNDVQDEMRDLAKESAETFIDAYEKAMDAAVQNMYQNLFGENNLDHLDRNWEWDKKVIDNYRDEVEKTFEIEQLRSKYNDLLNDAQGSSLATQNKIRKQMQEQLDLLKNQKSMSEYDVELANSKLLILQKQIALEDAQQNKNQMQLRRDSQGNYRYVYRASQNDIAKAREEYMQAVQDAYELTKEQRQKTAEELKNTLKDYAEEWRDVSTNMNLTEKERLQQSQELTERFLIYMKNLNEDLVDSQLGMSDVLNFMVENGTADVANAAQDMLTKLFDEQGNLIEDTDITWWDFGNDLMNKIFPSIETETEALNDTLKTEADNLRENLTGENGVIPEIQKALGEEGLKSVLDQVTVSTETLDDQMTSLTKSFGEQNEMLTAGMDNIQKYTQGLAAAIDWLKTAQDAIKDLQDITVGELVYETSAPLPEEAKSEEIKPEEPKPVATTTTTTTTTAKPAATINKLNADRVKQVYDLINGGKRSAIGSYSKREQDAGWAMINLVYPPSLNGAGWSWDKAMKYVLEKYDTGGYTGEWGKTGKLAFLHQKELVLNADDTRNILSAVDIVRQMTSTLGNVLTNYSLGGATSSLMNSGFSGIEQRVEIKAEFPNVRDSFEIETALTNLADKAYQYAHRNI